MKSKRILHFVSLTFNSICSVRYELIQNAFEHWTCDLWMDSTFIATIFNCQLIESKWHQNVCRLNDTFEYTYVCHAFGYICSNSMLIFVIKPFTYRWCMFSHRIVYVLDHVALRLPLLWVWRHIFRLNAIPQWLSLHSFRWHIWRSHNFYLATCTHQSNRRNDWKHCSAPLMATPTWQKTKVKFQQFYEITSQ